MEKIVFENDTRSSPIRYEIYKIEDKEEKVVKQIIERLGVLKMRRDEIDFSSTINDGILIDRSIHNSAVSKLEEEMMKLIQLLTNKLEAGTVRLFHNDLIL
jgi:hypothetical protein